jgi:nucleotide-binding universal stress UspA family protein
MPSHPTRIVVGYDGSPASLDALHWAAAEADRLHAPLRIVEAFDPVIAAGPTKGNVVPLAVVHRARERTLHTLAERVRLQNSGLTVETRLHEARPAEALLEESEYARLVVLGSRGLGGWSGLILGSVTVQLSAYAPCPTVVIPPGLRPGTRKTPTVVVAVDGSKTSAKAIDFAFDQAEARHARVVAVHAWTSPWLTYSNGQVQLQFDEEQAEESCRLLVAESVAGAAADHPDVPWTARLITGQAARAILQAAEAADLLVVGSRGHGGFAGLLLGSVSQSVLHHTPCPIAIVR